MGQRALRTTRHAMKTVYAICTCDPYASNRVLQLKACAGPETHRARWPLEDDVFCRWVARWEVRAGHIEPCAARQRGQAAGASRAAANGERGAEVHADPREPARDVQPGWMGTIYATRVGCSLWQCWMNWSVTGHGDICLALVCGGPRRMGLWLRIEGFGCMRKGH